VLSALGSVESLGQAALDLEQPRIRNLQRVARLVSAYGIVVTAGLAFLFAALVPEPQVWNLAPLAGVAYHMAAPYPTEKGTDHADFQRDDAALQR